MFMNQKRAAFAKNLIGTQVDTSVRASLVDEIVNQTNTHAGPRLRPNYHSPEERTLRPNEVCTPSVCFSCHNTCECLIYSDATTGKVLRVEGDPESPQTEGRLCVKGLSASNLVYNPERLTHPLKRVGPRGSGEFVPISWEEALDTTAQKMLDYKERLGPQSVAMLEGTRRGWSRIYTRLAYTFGLPNHGAAGWAQCFLPRTIESNLTFGRGALYPEIFDLPNADCIVCWGINPATTWGGGRSGDIMNARERGAALIVIDPFLSETAAKADIWLQVRPDTDTALALSMLNVIFAEELEDKDFISEWTVGIDELRDIVKDYTPQWGSEITGVDADLIVKAARLYGKAKAASVIRCLAIDQQHDSVQTCRAISCLIAVTGNVGNVGGNNLASSRGDVSQGTLDFLNYNNIPEEIMKLRSGYDKYPLLTQEFSGVPSDHMPSFWEQVISKDPYPIPCALIFGSNAMISYTNAGAVENALKEFEFLAVSDLFLTPTAKMADIVFPASSWLERKNVISSFQTSNTCTLIQQKVTSLGESWDDTDIVCELAKRLGVADKMWENSDEFYEYILGPTGLTFDQAAAQRRLYAPMEYELYKKRGFKTPSGKIELYSSSAISKNFHPLPFYTPSFQSHSSTPELAKEFPLIMTTGRHESAFRHSENRNNPYLIELNPQATLDIHPDTAKKLNIADGQKVLVESTANYPAYAYARYTLGLHPDVVQGIAGWAGEYNINLTVPWGQYADGVGTVCARGYLCRVTPVEEEK